MPSFVRWAVVVLAGVVAAVIASPAQVFTTLASFNVTNGAYPTRVSPVQGLDGSYYGTTGGGGTYNYGTVFKVTPGGTLTTVHSFTLTDGASPESSLVQATDGSFYGTTFGGGANDWGTVFRVTPRGTLTTLHSFDGTDGATPLAGLAQHTSGDFYGTTGYQGACGFGTVFKITPAGTLTTLYNFCPTSNFSDGATPYAGLVLATDGNFYGTTSQGGAHAYGTIFKITPAGTVTTLYSFCTQITQATCADGTNSYYGLVQGSDGNFYGTTTLGGDIGGGTVFKVTPGGTLTTLHSFGVVPDGAYPSTGLIQATDGNFYGATSLGGSPNGFGTIFKITLDGILTTLYSFDSTGGAYPNPNGLVQGTDGIFYGTTAGYISNYGGVFSLSVGLGPFVTTLPTSAKVGSTIRILGTNLTGTTSVTFGAKAATFSVVSPTQIVATVPANAVTGKVHVTPPSGTLTSNVVFRVMPVITGFSPPSGPVGTVVTITGQTLTGATNVTFGGVKATSFTVNSYTQITATVPTGAKTGRITVTTPGGKATSSGTFTVN